MFTFAFISCYRSYALQLSRKRNTWNENNYTIMDNCILEQEIKKETNKSIQSLEHYQRDQHIQQHISTNSHIICIITIF